MKRAKKLIAMMLSLVLVVAGLTLNLNLTNVYADIPKVTLVEVHDVDNTPTIGETPNTSYTLVANPGVDSVEVSWVDQNNNDALITTPFVAGMAPSVVIIIYINNGYMIDTSNFELHINGEYYGQNFANGNKMVWINIPFGTLGTTSVSEIHVTDLKINPIIGELPDTTCSVTETAVVSNISVKWKDHNTDTEITSAFEAGMAPSVYIEITLADLCYASSSDFTLYVNGESYGADKSDLTKPKTNIPFGTLKPQVPNTIEITDLDLDISLGEVLDKEVNINTEHATVDVAWTDKDSSSELDVVRYLSTPKLQLTITPEDGYSFTYDPTLKINGEAVVFQK